MLGAASTLFGPSFNPIVARKALGFVNYKGEWLKPEEREVVVVEEKK